MPQAKDELDEPEEEEVQPAALATNTKPRSQSLSDADLRDSGPPVLVMSPLHEESSTDDPMLASSTPDTASASRRRAATEGSLPAGEETDSETGRETRGECKGTWLNHPWLLDSFACRRQRPRSICWPCKTWTDGALPLTFPTLNLCSPAF